MSDENKGGKRLNIKRNTKSDEEKRYKENQEQGGKRKRNINKNKERKITE